MAIKKNVDKRAEARKYIYEKFEKKITNLHVLSDETRFFILGAFTKTQLRFSDMKFTKKSWDKYTEDSNKGLWKDYLELELQLKMLTIFSDTFFSALYLAWYELIQVFNPYTEFN